MISLFKNIFHNTSGSGIGYNFLGTDIHSHILPGIDDGSPDPDTSAHLINGLQSLGFTQFVTTPHIIESLYPNTPQTIAAAYEHIKPQIPQLPFHFAAEYMVDTGFMSLLQSPDRLLTFADNRILIEMSYLAESRQWRDAVFNLQIAGFKPVLAHPERYAYYGANLENFEAFIDAGCALQLNILSVTGYYGAPVKKTALKLLEHEMYTFGATDLHHDRHLKALTAFQFHPMMKTLANYPFQNSRLVLKPTLSSL